jgi:hypothetical protein
MYLVTGWAIASGTKNDHFFVPDATTQPVSFFTPFLEEKMMRHKKIMVVLSLLIPLLSTIFSCKKTPSTLLFRTEFGDLTVLISPNIPDEAAAQVAQLSLVSSDSLAVSTVRHNGFAELNFRASGISPTDDHDHAPVSGSFVVSNGRFFFVQGREHTDASLDKWALTNGRQMPPTRREQYKQKGGALALEGKCCVLGTIVSGKTTLDRIAALPSDATGKPLRAVSVHLVTLPENNQ